MPSPNDGNKGFGDEDSTNGLLVLKDWYAFNDFVAEHYLARMVYRYHPLYGPLVITKQKISMYQAVEYMAASLCQLSAHLYHLPIWFCQR